MNSTPKSGFIVCAFGIITILMQWHSAEALAVDSYRAKVAMFRPRMDVLPPTAAALPTTSESPESTLTELIDLIMPTDADPAPESDDDEGIILNSIFITHILNFTL